MVQNYQVASTFDILHGLKIKPRHTKNSARITFPPFYSRFSIAFLRLHFPSYLSVGRISLRYVHYGWLACPQLLFSYSMCSILFSSFHVCFQTGASRWQFPISIIPLNYTVIVSLALNDKHEEISSNAESSKSYRERHNKIRVMAVDFFLLLLFIAKVFHISIIRKKDRDVWLNDYSVTLIIKIFLNIKYQGSVYELLICRLYGRENIFTHRTFSRESI